MSPNKVKQKKDKLRNFNSIKHHINNLKSSMFAMKKSFISCIYRDNTNENQT